jgi:hypothetical protein
MFPPGRARLATSPSAAASPPTAMTMGIVVVASLRTRVPGPLVTMTSGWREINSAAVRGSGARVKGAPPSTTATPEDAATASPPRTWMSVNLAAALAQ